MATFDIELFEQYIANKRELQINLENIQTGHRFRACVSEIDFNNSNNKVFTPRFAYDIIRELIVANQCELYMRDGGDYHILFSMLNEDGITETMVFPLTTVS